MKQTDRFSILEYLIFSAVTLGVLCLCICLGSVNVPLADTLSVIGQAVVAIFRGDAPPSGMTAAIILSVRIPRVLCVGLVGASLSAAGAAMQGLLKNPLADGSTLGVSSGAALGAVIAIAFLPAASAMPMAMLFAFFSLLIILGLTYEIDHTLATNTIILMGVIFSMFVSSLINIVIAFAPDRIQHITFWTMGSLQGKNYTDVLILLGSLLVFGGIVVLHARELNAFAVGEENARHIGVNVRRVRLTLLAAVSGLIGICVSISGTIAFVGLVTPHMVRILTGPNHRRLLPASLFGGAVFLMLADLIARTMFNPVELPIGVVTSLVGAVVFLIIFCRRGKGR